MNTPPETIRLTLCLSLLSIGLQAQTATNDTSIPTSEVTLEQPPAAEDGGLAAKLANPVGSVYSVPIETTWDFGAPNGEATFINVQPVIPITLSEDWNLINRTIIPFIDAPGGIEGRPGNPEPVQGSRTFGLGDISSSFFFSPAKPGKVIWGVGPILGFPTASDSVLGSGKFTAGPTAVVLTQPKPWTMGVLVGNLWSYAGNENRGDVNQMFLQYFINYALGDGWYLTTTPMMTANWNASSSERWTIPVGGGAGKLFNVGKLPIRTQVQAFYNLDKPSGGADWSLMWTLQFVFPKK
jgi:hypothetical protein